MMITKKIFITMDKWFLLALILANLWTTCHGITMSMNATATGTNNGVSICPLSSAGINYTCISDHGESIPNENGQMWLELSFDNPGCVKYDYSMEGYKTIHLYCVYENKWLYHKDTVYVGEEISGVNVGDENGNVFIPMVSSATLIASYENGSDVAIEIVSNTSGNTLLHKNMTSKNQSITVSSADLNNVYGQHAVRVTLYNILNTIHRWIVLVLEEVISGFVFTTNPKPIVHIGDDISLGFTLTSGSDVVIVNEIGSLTLVDKRSSQLRTYPFQFKVNETGTYDITITLSNFVSVVNHSFSLTAQYPVHNITVDRTELMMVNDVNPIIFNMLSSALTPMGTLNAYLVIYENFTQTTSTKNISLTTLVPGGKVNEPMTYPIPGYYQVKVTIYSEIHEITDSWLKIVEYDIDLSLVALLSVPLSKSIQDIGVTINSPSLSPLYQLQCSFNIDEDVVNKTFEVVTFGDNATISYTYIGDGNKTLTISCANKLRSWTSTVYVDVYTDCFESTHLFDADYKSVNKPLKVYVTDVTEITGKVVISDKCKNSTRSYWWDFYDVNWRDRSTLSLMPYYNDSANQPEGIIISFAQEAIEPGLKKISLTANLTEIEGAVLSDHIYVDFQVPPIFALINGGVMKMVDYRDPLVVDAQSSSKEPYKKVQHIAFNFTWICRKVNHSDANKKNIEVNIAKFQSRSTDPSFYTIGDDCSAILEKDTAGKIEIPSSLTNNLWYVFFVNVSKLITTTSNPSLDINRQSEAVQAIHTVNTKPPDANIQCIRNCLNKITRDTVVILEIECAECHPATTSYLWNLKKYNKDSKDFEDISTVQKKRLLKTEDNTDTLAVAPEYLKYGDNVKITCIINIGGRIAETSYFFTINQPPYNGTCQISPEEGYASITYFEIKCSGWHDEGERFEQDLTKDVNEPLIYKFYQISNSTNDTYTTLLSQTPEPVAKAVLSIGDAEDDYWTDIRVKVTDKYNGYTLYYLKAQVKNKLKDLNDSSTEEVITAMKEFVSDAIDDAKATKDPTMLMKATATIVSVITQFDIQNTTNIDVSSLPTDWNSGVLDTYGNNSYKSYDEMLADIFQKPVDQYQQAVLQVMKNLTEQMLKEMQNSNSSTFYSVEIAANSFANVLNNPDYVNADIVEMVAQSLGQLVESFSNITMDKINPNAVFTSGTTSFKDSNDGIILLINNVVKATISEDLNEQSDSVLASHGTASARQYVEIMAYMNGDTAYSLIENSTITPEERAGIYFMRSRISELEVKRQRELAKISGDAVNAALESVTQTQLSILCKGCTDITEKSSILVYVQNDTIGEFNAQGMVQDNSTLNRIAIDNFFVSLDVPSSMVNDINKTYSTGSLSVSRLKRNIYIYDKTDIGVLISSDVHKLTFADVNQDPIKLASVNIYQPSPAPLSVQVMPYFTPDDASKLFYHVFFYRKTGDYVCLTLHQVEPKHNQEYIVYLRQEDYPTHLKYDIKTTISYDKDWMSCLPPQVFPPITGLMYIGLHAVPIPGATGFVWTPTSGKFHPGTYNISEPTLSPYSLTIVTSGCETWNEKSLQWADSCKMDWFPSENMISCQCNGNEGMTFGNSFYVAPNRIDFSTVFLKFSAKDQAAVLATFSVVIVVYIMLMVWGRHQDKKDIVKWGVTPLIDNFADDTYYYLITVQTGMRRGAGTKSRIGFIVSGDEYDSGVRELYDGVREEFSTASVQHFLMATSYPLGDLSYVYIFHDNSGEGAYSSWYLNRLDIEDLQERTRYVFLCGRWLSLDEEDSSIDAILPVCGKENVTTFQNMFYLNTKENLADNHMWVSIFYRPTSSTFTRCQRISCLLLFVMLTMIGNAIYFIPEDEFENTEVVRVGPLQFTWRCIYISFICAMISTPAVLVAILLFKKSKLRKISTDVRDKSLKYAVPMIDSMMERWLKESKELEKTLVAKGIYGTDGTILPWGFVIVAWIITLGGSFVAAFFVMLYSMEWGKQKTEVWLTQFAFSFFQSVCIVDPLKVVLMAAVFALILTSLEKFRPSGLKRDIILKNYRQRFGKESSIRIPAPPLSNELLEKARNERMREVKMLVAIKEIMITLVFLWIIFSISYSNRDHRSYLVYQSVEQQLTTPSKPRPQFDKITTHKDYVNWLSQSAFPSLFPEREYNGDKPHWRWRQYISDMANFRVGPPRLRQLRVVKSTENIPIVGKSTVYPDYKILKEETRDFCFSWKYPPCNNEAEAYSFSYRAWKFATASSIWGIPIAGLYRTYGGGGYIAELDVNWDFSNRTLDELTKHMWIDHATRAIFLEVLLYNANANLFAYCTFLTEFPETGGVIKMYSIYPLRIYQHLGATGVYIILCEVCFVLYLVAIIARVVYGIHQHGQLYFKSTWRSVDFLGVLGGIVAIAMYFGRFLLATETLAKFKADPKTFVNFQHIAIWDLLFVLLLGCLVFLATIRLLGILGYDKRIGQVFKVFDNCAWDLFWFCILFFYIFLGYCAFGYLLFGRELESYYNVFESMGTLFISMIGKSKFAEMNEKDPVMAQFYFFTFILIMVYFLLTMFLCVLGESISAVQAQSKLDRSEELVSYLIEKFKEVFGGSKYKVHKKKGFSDMTDSEKPLNLLQELRSELGSVMSRISDSEDLKAKMEKKYNRRE